MNLPLRLSKTAMNLNSLIEILNRKLIASHLRCLNATEVLLLRGIWQYQTYTEIAQQEDYSKGYISNVVAPGLCKRLSDLVGERITKKNCRAMLENYIAAEIKENFSLQQRKFSPKKSFPPNDSFVNDTAFPFPLEEPLTREAPPPYPNGAVPLDSRYYIERPRVETKIRQEIMMPGALVRVKAPQEMGKTSLLLRVLKYAREQNYRTVNLNLQQTDRGTLSDFKLFLRWICANITRQLDMESKLSDFWDEEIGASVSCMSYLEGYILDRLKTPLVVAFDEVNRIFEYPQVARDFLPLLRAWFEEAKKVRIWNNLRIMVVHSTEIYVPLHLTQSPFNVGLPIKLNSFTLKQVRELAQRYRLDWMQENDVAQLMALVGGHPGLVQIALYHLHQDRLTLPQLLKTAATATGIYAQHLQRHLANLQQEPELAAAFQQVVNANGPVMLEPIASYKLHSMGLIKREEAGAVLSCELYQRYFYREQSIAG